MKLKIIEAINRIDSLVPNGFSQQDKIAWLSTVDGVVKNNIINTHEGADKVEWQPYTETTSIETELLVPAPYDTMYIYWLQAQIDYWNQDMSKYNNSISMYNTAYSEYERFYNRTNAPKTHKFKFF